MNEAELFDRASHKSVLFCGERIIDVYHHVRPLGRPTKDAIVSVELLQTEEFEGGVTAAAAHAASFCSSSVYSAGQVIRKERFVEASHVRKLFECYIPGRAVTLPTPPYADYDAVIVTDYGHGMADAPFIAGLSTSAYLAINVQTNSGNYGFNLATKYQHADYLCVDEPEARLATQNRSGAIEDSLSALATIAPKVVVTLGKAGAIGCHNGVLARSGAFTNSVVDTIGAGDAFFAITALIAEQSDMATLLRIGNAAGALKAGIVGHRSAVSKHELIGLLARLPARSERSAERGAVRRHARAV